MTIIIFISIAYLILIISLIFGWRGIPEFIPQNSPAEIGFSVVIPFRNEAENIPFLLKSIANLQYPVSNFEVLLINDTSEDESVKICKEFQQKHANLPIHLLENRRTSPSPKKDAINTAINKAQFNYIITTDADCIVPAGWLQAFNDFILKTGANLVAGPVGLKHSPDAKKPYFQIFEELDVLSLQVAGAGTFGLEQSFMCNGANLCYEKTSFFELGGFEGNEKIASGDDVFLLQKFQQKGYKTAFLKCREAIVLTQPQQSLAKLVSQRIRWAAKTPAYHSFFAKFTGATILLMNLSLVLGFFLALTNILPYYPLLIIFLLKFNFDFALLYLSAKFFQREEVLRAYFWSSIVYPFFSSFIAVLSLFSGYEWKGRKFER